MSSIDRIVERQIRQAQERGDFDNLPGAGRPLPDSAGPHDENWWLRQYLIREGIDGAPFLPPALALRKEVEDLPAKVATLPTEAMVRAVVTELNERILAALKKPSGDGPPMSLTPRDPDAVILAWRRARAPRPGPVAPAVEPPVRRRWFRRPR